MVDVSQIERALDRLPSVEAELGDPAVLQDRSRYRAVLADYRFLKRLDYAYVAYQLGEASEPVANPIYRDPPQPVVITHYPQSAPASPMANATGMPIFRITADRNISVTMQASRRQASSSSAFTKAA